LAQHGQLILLTYSQYILYKGELLFFIFYPEHEVKDVPWIIIAFAIRMARKLFHFLHFIFRKNWFEVEVGFRFSSHAINRSDVSLVIKSNLEKFTISSMQVQFIVIINALVFIKLCFSLIEAFFQTHSILVSIRNIRPSKKAVP